MKYMIRVMVLLTGFWASFDAFSWDGAVDGKIGAIQVTQANNFPFRVSLVGNPALCGNVHAWAYLSASDSSYQTYVSMLIAAKYANSTVRIHSNRDSAGYCMIGHIIVE